LKLEDHKQNTEALLEASREVGLEVSHHQNVGQNHNSLIPYKSFENVVKFKYLRKTVRNPNCIHEEIKSTLNSGNACYHSVQSLLSSRLFSKNLKKKNTKKTSVLYGCEN
jgi:hypothetical protein